MTDPRQTTDSTPTHDWKIFKDSGAPHDDLGGLPKPPPWRFAHKTPELVVPAKGTIDEDAEERRASPFITTEAMRIAVNAALYLRRPLLLTGKPGTGKSTLIAKVAHELRLGRVLRWPINSRSTVRSGIYEYDAVGRLQSGLDNPPVQQYLKLGPLGTALTAQHWPRALLIDEIDKSDLDFANDLLNVIEEAEFEIPELRRLPSGTVSVKDFEGDSVDVVDGRLKCGQFPFVVMTSNGEREFPAPFLRRCIRVRIEPPTASQLADIIDSHLADHKEVLDRVEIDRLIGDFIASQRENVDIATDQLLNAVFLTVSMKDVHGRTFDEKELGSVRQQLLKPLGGQGT
jgi:MoxR-like ATPase